MANWKKNAGVLVTTTLILLSKTANHQYEYQDPKTITTFVRDVVNDDATVKISVFQVGNKYNPAMSIFSTDVLQHYGNGKLQFNIAGFSECNLNCTAGNDLADPTPLTHLPCLAVSKYCPHEQLKCAYPQCMTVILNDEFCNRIQEPYDIRQYYTTNANKARGYLPLGPRKDSWDSFQLIKQKAGRGDQFTILPSSQRKFAFNAIFSQNTHPTRQKLANMIIETIEESAWPHPIFSVMAKQWSPDTKSNSTEQLNSDDYMQVVLDSAFTLSPAGHNPECFRLYEAIEAGSIPILTKDDMRGVWDHIGAKEHPCKDAMEHWYTAPLVILDTWDDLFPTVERLLSDPVELDKLQNNLLRWYDDYMHLTMTKFEDLILAHQHNITEEAMKTQILSRKQIS